MKGDEKMLPDGNCTGCSACYSVCPRNAISMAQNNEGFYKPVIKEESCINCKLCECVCPILKDDKDKMFNNPTLLGYASKAKNVEVQVSSTSGGTFSAIAQEWIKKGGVVYGAAYDSDCCVRHIRVEHYEDLKRLSDSKYVQSSVGGIFKAVKIDLSNKIPVLFSGTSCQIAGLKNFLDKPYPNLYCVDLICHGVPSPKVWNWYIKCLVENKGSRPIYIRHKGKDKKGWSWKKQYLFVKFEDGTELKENIWENSYIRGFLKDLYLNIACHECKFKNMELCRVSDLTIADYWGCEDVESDFFDVNGVNLVLVNTDKGRELIYHSTSIDIKETEIDRALGYNVAALKPYRKPYARQYFFKKFASVHTITEFERLILSCEKILAIETPISKFSNKIKRKLLRK